MGNLIRQLFGQPRAWKRLEDIPRNVKVRSEAYPSLETWNDYGQWMTWTGVYGFPARNADGPFTEVKG